MFKLSDLKNAVSAMEKRKIENFEVLAGNPNMQAVFATGKAVTRTLDIIADGFQVSITPDGKDYSEAMVMETTKTAASEYLKA